MKKYTVGPYKWIANIKDESDNTPKTPEWAFSITGIDAAKLRELAEFLATSKTEIAGAWSEPDRSLIGAWSLQRAQHGEITHWAILNFSALTGRTGKPGQGGGFSWHYGNGGMPQLGENRVPSQPDYRNAGKPRQGNHL